MSPVQGYIERLAATSQKVVRSDARILAGALFPGVPADAAPWHTLDGAQTGAAMAALARTRSPNTVLRLGAVLRGILRTCWRQGTMTTEQLARACDFQAARGRRVRAGRALTWPEVDTLLGACGSAAERCVLALGVGGGLRASEIAGFRIEDVAKLGRRGGTVDILVRGKGARQREQRLPRWAAELVLAWVDDPDCRYGHGLPWTTPGAVNAWVRTIAHRAGIGKLTAHDLRRTFASLYLSSGGSLASLRRAMGHTNPATTALYDHRDDEEVRAEVARRLEIGEPDADPK